MDKYFVWGKMTAKHNGVIFNIYSATVKLSSRIGLSISFTVEQHG